MQRRQSIVTYQKNYWKLSSNSLSMITKQQIRINYIEKIRIKSDAKKIKNIRYQKTYCKLPANSLTLTRKQQITINYIEELRMKSDAKKVKYYLISKKSLEAFGQFSGHGHEKTN